MSYSDDPLIVVSFVLQLAVIVFLLQGVFRKYPLILVYSALRFATGVLEVFIMHTGGKGTRLFRQLYYSDRVALNLVLFLMVTAIIYDLLEETPRRSMIGKILLGIVASVLLLPFLVLSGRFTIHWLNGMSQFLYFGSEIMTLVLWTVLLTSRSRDPQLVKFTVGLGVAMAGAAISFGLQQRMHAPHLVWMPNLFLQVTHVAGVLFWCWAFRPVRRRAAEVPSDPAFVSAPSHELRL